MSCFFVFDGNLQVWDHGGLYSDGILCCEFEGLSFEILQYPSSNSSHAAKWESVGSSPADGTNTECLLLYNTVIFQYDDS